MGKLETFAEDANYVMNLAGLNVSIPWRQNRHTTSKIESDYYSQITKSQLLALYAVYQMDFELFNYSVDPYDTYVKQ